MTSRVDISLKQLLRVLMKTCLYNVDLLKPNFYVHVSGSWDILFLPLSVSWFVVWTILTLVITFEPFEIKPFYLACRFLVTRASHLYKKV